MTMQPILSSHRPPVAAAMPHSLTKPDTLRTVRHGYTAAVVVAAVVQLLFFSRPEFNLVCTALALAASLLGIGYALDSARFRRHPISALILLLFTTTSTSGALIVKSLEWTPLVDRLQVPLTTFAVLLGAQLALMLADYVYIRSTALANMRVFIAQRLLAPLGMLRWPSDFELWLLGGLGCLSVIVAGTDFESDASFGFASAGTKLIRAFGFLKFAPFLIPFRNALSGVDRRTTTATAPLLIYFAGLVGISFATNSRSTFADAIPTIGICVLIAIGIGRLDFRRVSMTKILTLGILAVVGGILLSRVALAMVVVRDFRHNADVGTLVRMTFDALTSSEWLESAKARMDTSVTVANYSETYVDSRFFGRFLLTKFHDNILYYFSLMGPDQIASYKGFMLDRLLGTMPDPLLRLIGLSIDKQDLVVSNGDYIIYLVDGWGLGGFKTGSLIGEVYGVFGWAYVLVLMLCTIVLFVVHDAFAVRSRAGAMVFAPLIILLIWNLCGTTAAFGFGAETVTAIPANLVRGLPQNILAYVVAVALVRVVGRLAGRGGRIPKPFATSIHRG